MRAGGGGRPARPPPAPRAPGAAGARGGRGAAPPPGGHAPEARQRAAGDPRRRHLDDHLATDRPALPHQSRGEVEPAGAKVLAEDPGRCLAAQRVGPEVGVLVGVRVQRLVDPTVVARVPHLVTLEPEGQRLHRSVHRSLVDGGAAGTGRPGLRSGGGATDGNDTCLHWQPSH
jgi:hypothetical protein